MDGDGFDTYAWDSQPSASAPAHAPAPRSGLDLNSQAPPAERFPGLGLYGAILQGDDGDLLPGRVGVSGFHPYRPPRAVAGEAWETPTPPYAPTPPSARQLQFGGSSSVAAGHGGGNSGFSLGGSSSGAGGGVRQRANSAIAAPGCRNQRGSGIPRPRAPRAPRNVVRVQASGSGASFNNGAEELEDDVEELASSGGPPEEEDDGGSTSGGTSGGSNAQEEDDGGSTSEDEIVSMCRNNLVQSQNLILQLVPILGMYSDNHFVKLPRRVSGDSGLAWVHETLARDTQCYNMFRVERPLFNRLHNTLVQSYGLKSTTKMTSVESIAMFLWIVGSPQSVRHAENRFRWSMETVSRTFNTVLTCLLRLAHDIIVPKDPTFSEVHPNLENPTFWPHFNDCIGAIDGTHVKLVVQKSKRVAYLNRHNETSQNVLAICDFDMRFTFVLSGWPGSAHDVRVFKDAITTHHHKFPHPPPGKYYVVDAGYQNKPGYLSPYRCTRYHVEQWQNGPPPQGMKETFNHAHAKVRNVIERSFGVLKMKFRILLNMPRFPEEKQTRIIVACMALHNFIRESRIVDREFAACDADENYNPMPSSSTSGCPEDEPLVEDVNMNAFRDELAHALFHGV